jgi:two-component system cell cycle response regulator DivK
MSTVLIVEDSARNMKLLRDILQHQGHATLEAATAAEAVQLAVEQVPDLILMDIQLPDLAGTEALRQMRTHPELDATPVLAVSASVMPEQHRAIVKSGFDAFISKPIDLKHFRETVQHFITHGRKPE